VTGTSEADEIYKICSVLGSPTMRTWPEGIKLSNQMNFRFPQFVATPLTSIIPNASPEALTLISDLLKYDPNQRPTASQALQYPFFQVRHALHRVTAASQPYAAQNHDTESFLPGPLIGFVQIPHTPAPDASRPIPSPLTHHVARVFP
jgi:serine/threonine protein kinase